MPSVEKPIVLLIPTQSERNLLEPYLHQRLIAEASCSTKVDDWRLELCGFGLVAAAACAAEAIARHRPRRVVLTGIAGSFVDTVPIGSACHFDRVTCHGIGVGDSLTDFHCSADALGWAHCEANDSRSSIGDTIKLACCDFSPDLKAGHLISVTTASANELEANRRRARFPDAAAEDMEGFAVALVCQLNNIPLQIVRGISNRVGDRNLATWKTEAALRSATDLVLELMGREL